MRAEGRRTKKRGGEEQRGGRRGDKQGKDVVEKISIAIPNSFCHNSSVL
jgi:hypothetical protein